MQIVAHAFESMRLTHCAILDSEHADYAEPRFRDPVTATECMIMVEKSGVIHPAQCELV
jgi:hypothetical protein